MTFAIEGDVAGTQRILRIRAGAIERAVQIRRNLAVYFAIMNVDLGAEQRRTTSRRRTGIAFGHVAAAWWATGWCTGGRTLLGCCSSRCKHCTDSRGSAEGVTHELATIDLTCVNLRLSAVLHAAH
jgi:hypothetical protein